MNGRTGSAAGEVNGHAAKSVNGHFGSIDRPEARVKGIGNEFISSRIPPWPREKEEAVLAPYDYMIGHPGKDIRSQLITAFNAWLRVPEDKLDVITGIVGMLHTSSLLVDDVEDNSVLRRGVPVAHSIFGTAQTINSANYVYFRALQELQRLRNPQAIFIFTEEMLNLHRGQGMDLWWRDNLSCPTEQEYLEMVNNKTGGLFRLAIKLMQAEKTTAARDCVPLVNVVGMLFQILDDYNNLSSDRYTTNKGLAEDLTEGKFSFPIIHSIRSDPSNPVLSNILRQKTMDEEVKRFAIRHMESTGSFAYTRAAIAELSVRALQLVDEIDKAHASDGINSNDPNKRHHSDGEGVRLIIEKLKVDD